LGFSKKEGEWAILDLMRRFSGATRFAYNRLLEGKSREEFKRAEAPPLRPLRPQRPIRRWGRGEGPGPDRLGGRWLKGKLSQEMGKATVALA
jgi:hypothetical protein